MWKKGTLLPFCSADSALFNCIPAYQQYLCTYSFIEKIYKICLVRCSGKRKRSSAILFSFEEYLMSVTNHSSVLCVSQQNNNQENNNKK